jgi:hypothetical protein
LLLIVTSPEAFCIKSTFDFFKIESEELAYELELLMRSNVPIAFP